MTKNMTKKMKNKSFVEKSIECFTDRIATLKITIKNSIVRFGKKELLKHVKKSKLATI